MDQNKKRRNSILKKTPYNEDDTTGNVTTKIKRRISFSGKKSVKEFIAGEEEATIWGTSYEESADCLQANPSESGLVNVHEKRIVLRSRRVIVEQSVGNKRRSKKKASVAENDKENICVQQIQNDSKAESNHQSTQLEQSKQQQAEPIVDGVESYTVDLDKATLADAKNICSSTFDFINFSALANKSISIEQSVDVTLSERELQMFKFRVPVAASNISPSLSLSSLTDVSPSNRSLLMSEEDRKILKFMRGKKEAADAQTALQMPGVTETEELQTETNVNTEVSLGKTIEEKDCGTSMDLTGIEAECAEDETHAIHLTMAVSHCEVIQSKDLKRKTNLTNVVMDEDEPKGEKLDVYLSQTIVPDAESSCNRKRATMHMNQTINTSRTEYVEVKSLKRKTITQSVAMEQSCMWTDTKVTNNQSEIDISALDINSPIRKKPMNNATSKPMDITNIIAQNNNQREPTKRQTMYFDSAPIDESFTPDRNYPPIVDISMEQCTDLPIVIGTKKAAQDRSSLQNNDLVEVEHNMSMELSEPNQMSKSNDKERRTIYEPTDMIGGDTVPSHQMVSISKISAKSRKSIYTPSDMIVDSPTPKVIHQLALSLQTDETEGSGKVPSIQKTIYTPTDIIEESPKSKRSVQPAKSKLLSRRTINSSADIDEDVVQHSQIVQTSSKKRESVYTPSDIIEDSPTLPRPTKPAKSNVAACQTICGPIDFTVSHSPETTKISQLVHDRTVKTPVEIFEDSTETALPPIQSAISGPKVVIRHLNLEQTPKVDKIVLRQLNVELVKSTAEPKPDDVAMDITMLGDLSDSENSMNFCKLNEKLLKGELKAEEKKKGKMSLFECLAQKPPEVVKFDSLVMNEKNPNDVILQRPRNSMKDYTMEFSTKKTDYTMDFSLQSVNMPSLGERSQAERQQREPSHRQTIYLNKDIDLDVSKSSPVKDARKWSQEESMSLSTANVSRAPNKSRDRQTIHCNETLEEGTDRGSTALRPEPIVIKHNSPVALKSRQTIVFHQNNDLEVSIMENKQPTKTKSIQISKDDSSMDVSMLLNDPKDPPKEVNPVLRQTVIEESPLKQSLGKSLNQNGPSSVIFDVGMDMSITDHAGPYDSKRQMCHTRHIMDPHEPELRSTEVHPSKPQRRQRIHCNDDLERDDSIPTRLDKSPEDCYSLYLSPTMGRPEPCESKSQTSHTRHAMDLHESKPFTAEVQTSKPRKRQTIHCNEEIKLDNTISPHQMERLEDIHKQQSSPQTSKPRSRPTIHFNQHIEEDDYDYSTNSTVQLLKLPTVTDKPMTSTVPKRHTLHFNEDIEVEEENENETKSNTAQNALRRLNRQTMHFHQNIDSQDINSEPKDNRVEPVKALPKPRRLTILDEQPIDIDESPQKFTARKSSFSRALNFNEIQTVDNKIQHQTSSLRRNAATPVEDDNSPFYNFSAKSRLHETTSEIDRSLSEYLKAEAAATLKNSPDISMDVTNSGQKNHQTTYSDASSDKVDEEQRKSRRQTTHEAVNIFEESGMQPLLQSILKRQTTFAREDMMLEEPSESLSKRSQVFRKEQTYLNTWANSKRLETDDKLENKSELSSEAGSQHKFMPQKHPAIGQSQRKTILEPEPMVEEYDADPAESVSKSLYVSRKEQTYLNTWANSKGLETDDKSENKSELLSVAVSQYKFMPQKHSAIGQSRRQTILEPEPMVEEYDAEPAESVSKSSHVSRKEQTYLNTWANSNRLETDDKSENKSELSSEAGSQHKFMPQKPPAIGQSRRQTILEPEPMVEEYDAEPVESVSKRSQVPRKEQTYLNTWANSERLETDDKSENKSEVSSEAVSQHKFMPQKHSAIGQSRRQTILEPEPMVEEYDAEPVESVSKRSQVSRKEQTFLNTWANSKRLETNDKSENKSEVSSEAVSQHKFMPQKHSAIGQSRRQTILEPEPMVEEYDAEPAESVSKSSHVSRKEQTYLNTWANSKRLETDDKSENKSELSSEAGSQHKFMPQKPPAIGQSRRQTILEPEPMVGEYDDSMEFSMNTEELIKCSSNPSLPSRKTIHFTNENAVDESFFDENLSKPASSHNNLKRHTLLFDEDQSPIDVTLAVSKAQIKPLNKSKAAQSMKEILLETNMLFNQVELTTFDEERANSYFTEKDRPINMSKAYTNMECENPQRDPECTPTKNKLSKSRIPQLIDSAKKLKSMKKSIEFIQQELPHLGAQSHNALNLNKTFEREFSAYEKEPESQEAPGTRDRDPQQLQESFDTVEIPRRATINVARQLQESFDTVEIPRRATNFQKNDTLNLFPNQNEIAETTNLAQLSLLKFEDTPITVSDVSTYFSKQMIPINKPINETYSHNTTEALCNLDANRFVELEDQLPKSSDSEDTAHNFDKFKKRYVELTCDSIMISAVGEEIEKTHLSLVDTLDEMSECVQPKPAIEDELSKVADATQAQLKAITSVCRKCKRHRLSETQNDTTIGSFMLEPLPEYKMNLAALEELGNKPKISDVTKIWRQKMRESDSFNISDENRSNGLDDTELVNEFIATLDNERLAATQCMQRKEIKVETSFVQKVRLKVESKNSNWILNELLLAAGILQFTHTRLRTFAIFAKFKPKDSRGTEVDFSEIQLVPNNLHTCQWSPFDYALHYQLLVELPFDIRKLCPTSDHLFQLLDHVESVTKEVLKTGNDMWYLVLTSPASLIREPSGRLYIQKFARIKTPQNEVKRTEFQIEVRNINKLSYKSIAQPPLYEFDETIQTLPEGINFLKIFLADPVRYTKETM